MCVEPSLRCKYSIDGRAFQRGLCSSVSVVYTYLRVTTANLTVTFRGFLLMLSATTVSREQQRRCRNSRKYLREPTFC